MLRADEVPPPDLLVLFVAPFPARRDDLPDFGAEESQVIVGQIEIAVEKAADVVQCDAYVAHRAGGAGNHIDRKPSVPVQSASRRVDKVVGDGSGWPVRDSGHRVGDVTVEAGEEPEPVFAGQILAAVLARARQGKAAGLAARDGKQFVDFDVEVALYEFMGGAEAGDASAEDDDLRFTGQISRLVFCALAAARLYCAIYPML